MKARRRWLLGVGSCLMSVWATGVMGGEILLRPIGASGVHQLNGNQIVLTGADQIVTLEIRVDSWDAVPDVGVCSDGSECSLSNPDCPVGSCVPPNGLLAAYQARIDSSGYGGVLVPAIPSCAVDADCLIHGAPFAPCDTGTNECAPDAAGYVDSNHPDYVFASAAVSIPAVSFPVGGGLDWAFGAVVIIGETPAYPGIDKYGGTLVLQVPAGAMGSFTIGFVNSPIDTFMRDSDNTTITPLTLTPAVITVACETQTDCDDQSACTSDTCNVDGTCSNVNNFDDVTFCCNPLDGSLTVIDDGIECTQDSCNADGSVGHPFLPGGAACGDPANAPCDNPDTCDGAGVCQDNLEPVDTACGDPAEAECDHADTCDGAGVCRTNIEPPGVSCGDASGTDCTDPDTCDGIGGCDANDMPDGVTCDDGLFCNDGEMCTGGLCGGGAARDCDDGLTCTTDSCNEAGGNCENVLMAGNCLIDGACYADGEFNPVNDCEECNTVFVTDAWSLRAVGSVCDDGNPCTGTGAPPGTGDDTCDDAGVCSGVLDPSCNDNCSDAVEVFEGVNTGNNSTAGPVDDAEASCQPNSNHDVWFVYAATCNGTLLLTTTGTMFEDSGVPPANDPVLSVYDACGGAELACDDDGGPDLQAALTMVVAGGVQYFIRVAGFGDGVGDIVLNLSLVNDCVIDGVCYAEGAVNPANECEECIPVLSPLSWSPRLKGTSCGDGSTTECTNPDACDGAGVCEQNHKPDNSPCPDEGNDCTADLCASGACAHPPLGAGTPCGDPSDGECDNPDTCDGASVCLSNFELQGVACGDSSSDQCDNPDICDGGGGCDPNYQPVGTPCDDSDVCTTADECALGSCAGVAEAQAPIVQALGGRRLQVTPQPAGAPGAVALLVTSPTWTCLSRYIDTDGSLTDTAVFQLADDWGTVIVVDEDLVPTSGGQDSIYDVQAQCGVFTSPAGSAVMGVWGDMNGDGETLFDDILLVVRGFQGDFSGAPLEVLDIDPCTPDGFVNFVDILQDVRAFQGMTYEQSGCPVPCP